MRAYRISEDEYVEARMLHLRLRTCLPLIIIVFLGAFMLLSVPDAHDFFGWAMFAFVILGLGYAVFELLPKHYERQIRKFYKEEKRIAENSSVAFNHEYVEWTNVHGTSRLPWKNVLRCKENDQMFLIYESRNLLHIVPKRVFENEAELRAFREELKLPEGN